MRSPASQRESGLLVRPIHIIGPARTSRSRCHRDRRAESPRQTPLAAIGRMRHLDCLIRKSMSTPDTNALVAATLRDLAAVQRGKQSAWGYKRAAAAVL